MINRIFKTLLVFVALTATATSYASRIDTLMVRSDKMDREIEVIVVVPQQAINNQKCPALYLLHGYGGDARTWFNIKPELKDMADRDGTFIVCPDG